MTCDCVSGIYGLGLLGEKWDALEKYCMGFSKDWRGTGERDLLQITEKTKHTGFRKSPEQKVVGSWNGTGERGHNAYLFLNPLLGARLCSFLEMGYQAI